MQAFAFKNHNPIITITGTIVASLIAADNEAEQYK
jgi:hypothetical protein